MNTYKFGICFWSFYIDLLLLFHKRDVSERNSPCSTDQPFWFDYSHIMIAGKLSDRYVTD